MGRELDELVAQVAADNRYGPMFDAAFPGVGTTRATLPKALAQFVRSIVSFDAPWDHIGHMGDIDDPAATRGHEPFSQKLPLGDPDGILDMCDRCHQARAGLVDDWAGHESGLFMIEEQRNNGLPIDEADLGRFEVTAAAEDRGRFDVPSLRNITLTAPYMHDGRFSTLEEVLTHYNEEIVATPTTDEVFLRDGEALKMNFDPASFGDMIAFFELFTDPNLATNPAWSDPFLAE